MFHIKKRLRLQIDACGTQSRLDKSIESDARHVGDRHVSAGELPDKHYGGMFGLFALPLSRFCVG